LDVVVQAREGEPQLAEKSAKMTSEAADELARLSEHCLIQTEKLPYANRLSTSPLSACLDEHKCALED